MVVSEAEPEPEADSCAQCDLSPDPDTQSPRSLSPCPMSVSPRSLSPCPMSKSQDDLLRIMDSGLLPQILDQLAHIGVSNECIDENHVVGPPTLSPSIPTSINTLGTQSLPRPPKNRLRTYNTLGNLSQGSTLPRQGGGGLSRSRISTGSEQCLAGRQHCAKRSAPTFPSLSRLWTPKVRRKDDVVTSPVEFSPEFQLDGHKPGNNTVPRTRESVTRSSGTLRRRLRLFSPTASAGVGRSPVLKGMVSYLFGCGSKKVVQSVSFITQWSSPI